MPSSAASTYGGAVGLLSKLGAGGTVVAASGHDSWAELDLTDFANLVAKLPEQYADGSESYICSSGFYAFMIKAAGGAAQGFAEDGTPLFMGKRVNLLPTMPASSAASQVCCLFGNWRESVILGDHGLKFAISDLSPEVFAKDLIAVRSISRYGLVVRDGGTASAAGSFVGLQTAAS